MVVSENTRNAGSARSAKRHLVWLAIFASTLFTLYFPLFTSLHAQKYSPDDTVTEYSMRGTMYHNKFEGRKTANGEIFNHNLFSAAHRKFKFGTLLLVTNKNTGLSVIVKVNDRCPKKTVLDMTRRAAYGIGIKGCQPVIVRVLSPTYEEEWAAQDEKYDSVASRFATGKYTLAKRSEVKNTKKNRGKRKMGKVSQKNK